MRRALWDALLDFREGLRLAPLWLSLGWAQTVLRFRRTVLGPFWLAANLLAMSFALALVYGGIMGSSYIAILPSIISGILTWSLIGGAYGEAAGVFVASSGMMTSQRLPLSFHIFLMMFRIFINFVSQLLALWVLFLVMRIGGPPTWQLLLGLPVLFCSSIFICLLIAIPSTRYRDIGQFVANVVSLLFFLTPVFWSPLQMRSQRGLVKYNPLAHLLEIVRQPLIGHVASRTDWVWSLGTCAATGLAALVALALFRKRVVFWL